MFHELGHFGCFHLYEKLFLKVGKENVVKKNFQKDNILLQTFPYNQEQIKDILTSHLS